MHRFLFTLSLLLLSTNGCAQGGEATRWVPGLRAGFTTLPYERRVPSLASGGYLGGQLSYLRAGRTRLSFAFDVGRVANLQVSQQFSFTGLLANERIKVTDFKEFSGYTFLRFGVDFQPGSLQSDRFGLGLQLNLEGLVGLYGGFRRAVFSATFDRDITETTTTATGAVGLRTASTGEVLTAEDVRPLVLTAGPQLTYQFPAGPQLSAAVLFDLNKRLLSFTNTAPRLLFLQFGFTHSLSR